jgi:hypothetical protein
MINIGAGIKSNEQDQKAGIPLHIFLFKEPEFYQLF